MTGGAEEPGTPPRLRTGFAQDAKPHPRQTRPVNANRPPLR